MKILISLITLTVLANASYEKVQQFYESGEYLNAIQEAKSSTEEYSNPKLHLLWAKSAESLGDTNEAMAAYERVAMLDANSADSRVALLKIYQESSREALAQEMSSELENFQLTPQQRTSLGLLKGKEINTLKARATLALGHDSNINVSAKASDLDAYYGLSGYEGEKSTLFARVNGSVSYVNELQEKGGWYVQGDLNAYYQNNFDASYFNMFVGTLEAGVGYAGDGYTLYMPIGYDRVNYLESDLLGQIRVAPRANISLSEDFILNVNAKYATREYQDVKYKGMSDSTIASGAGLYYIFDKSFAYLNLKYEDFRQDNRGSIRFIDKTMTTLSIGVNYSVQDLFVARFDYRYRAGQYEDNIFTDSERRADSYNQVELKLSRYIAKNYELFISDRYVKNDSNYIPAQYSKNIFMFGVSANY
ncbi:MAG: hypothetical protein U9O86_09590 [Campylobacterota bacterium]|nr:hypothetical protein [Campylobacterota bacterium]